MCRIMGCWESGKYGRYLANIQQTLTNDSGTVKESRDAVEFPFLPRKYEGMCLAINA